MNCFCFILHQSYLWFYFAFSKKNFLKYKFNYVSTFVLPLQLLKYNSKKKIFSISSCYMYRFQ